MTELLSNTGFIMYNKTIAHKYGVNEAILIGELCAKYQYWLERGDLLQSGGWFYVTREDIEKDTCLSSKQQRSAFKNLQDDEIISCKLMGVPAKLFYRINTENLYNLMCQKVTPVCDEKAQQAVTKGNGTNRYNKKETKKETNIYSPVVGYLNEKAGTDYRPGSHKTRALIDARVNEGFTLEDFKAVIDRKCADWNHAPPAGEKDMRPYLRPETLFGPKFESYLNQKGGGGYDTAQAGTEGSLWGRGISRA